MKVLHINTGQEGGAAWCARRICQELLVQGVESKMLFAEGNCMPKGIEGGIAEKDDLSYRSNWIIAKLRHLLMRFPWYWNVEKLDAKLNHANVNNLYIHHPMSNFQNIVHHPLVEWADIVHLHWVSGFLDYPTFFKNVKKPIVWTLHDMHPAIGVMHFESEYTILPKELHTIDEICKKIKKQGLSYAVSLNIVAISEKMLEIINSSELLKNFPVTIIRNGVNTKIFKPLLDKSSIVRNFLDNLKSSTIVFLFSSYGISDKRKGLDRIVSALNIVKKQENKDIALIAIGMINKDTEFPESTFPIYYTGLVKDQNELAKIYTQSDFFINASYEEAFAQTPLEAMSCGCPVISTPCSGASDLIRTFNGVICDGYDPHSLSLGISKALSMNFDPSKIRQNILEKYEYKIIAEKYINLYSSVLNEYRRNNRKSSRSNIG